MENESVVVTSGTVFAISGRTGDISPKSTPGDPQGMYAYDTRFLSKMILTLDGRDVIPVGASPLNHSIASFYTSSRGTRSSRAGTISIVRDRYVSNGIHEDIHLVNHSMKTRKVHLEVAFDADFADVFEVRLGIVKKAGKVSVEQNDENGICLIYEREKYRRETCIHFSIPPQIKGKTASFDIVLEPKKSWKTCISILPVEETLPGPIACIQEFFGPPFGPYKRRNPSAMQRLKEEDPHSPLSEIPKLETNHMYLKQAYEQSIIDLQALLTKQDNNHYILAAGIPWFVAIFGRDSIISAIQTKLLGPQLMIGTIHTLADLQSVEFDKFRDAEPGKMPHEVRKGELSFFEEVPHTRYYGSIDTTPLFLILLWEQFLIDSALLTFTGGLIGVGMGWGGSYLVGRLGLIQTLVTTDIVFLAVAVSVGIGLFFGFYPAWQGSRMDPIQALRSE